MLIRLVSTDSSNGVKRDAGTQRFRPSSEPEPERQRFCFVRRPSWSRSSSGGVLLGATAVNVCSLLQETLIRVWAQAARASERARVREREREGSEGGNRSEQGTSPPDAGTDHTPDLNTHSYPAEGPEPVEERHNRELGSEVRGQRGGSLFFFVCLR